MTDKPLILRSSQDSTLTPFPEIARRMGISEVGAIWLYKNALRKLRRPPRVRRMLDEALAREGRRSGNVGTCQ